MLLAPPARTSSSATGVVHGLGANHFCSSSGVVQQRKIFSGVASITRVSTSCRSVLVVVIAVLLFGDSGQLTKERAGTGGSDSGAKLFSVVRVGRIGGQPVDVHADMGGFGRRIRQRDRAVEGLVSLFPAAELEQQRSARPVEVEVSGQARLERIDEIKLSLRPANPRDDDRTVER